jgi:hypothetical protein
VEEVLLPDAQLREEDGKRPSQSVFDEMARQNLIAMRLGPGPHLKGRVLMGGIVKPEEVSCYLSLKNDRQSITTNSLITFTSS